MHGSKDVCGCLCPHGFTRTRTSTEVIEESLGQTGKSLTRKVCKDRTIRHQLAALSPFKENSYHSGSMKLTLVGKK